MIAAAVLLVLPVALARSGWLRMPTGGDLALLVVVVWASGVSAGVLLMAAR